MTGAFLFLGGLVIVEMFVIVALLDRLDESRRELQQVSAITEQLRQRICGGK